MNLTKLFLIGLILLGATTIYFITRNPDAGNHLDLYAFHKFKRDFGVSYQNYGEESYRFSVFLQNLKTIESNNANPQITHVEQVNLFADLTREEFAARFLMKDLSKYMNKNLPNLEIETLTDIQPVDWTNKNILPPIKRQMECSSGWAFSAAGMLEAIYDIHEKPQTPISFSEQQLVDCCDPNVTQCYGCSGGFPFAGVEYAQQYGIVQENEYPYLGRESKCKTELQGTGFKPSAQFQIPRNTAALQAALQVQPISVTIDAQNWQHYSIGTFYYPCSPFHKDANHSALLVGLKANGNWIVRNSWSTQWGQLGYITLAAGNSCGIQNFAIYANY